MLQPGTETGITFAGHHCAEYGAICRIERWPVLPKATVNKVAISGRNGSVRYPGKTYAERTLECLLYLVDPGGSYEPLGYPEMRDRLSQIAGWLGAEGRAPLTLDCTPDRYWIAEVEGVTEAEDTDWPSGALDVSYTLQPYEYALHPHSITVASAAATSQQQVLYLDGTQPAPLDMHITNTGPGALSYVWVGAGSWVQILSGMALPVGQHMSVWTDIEAGDVQRIEVRGQPGKRYLHQDSNCVTITLQPGRNVISYYTDRACTVRWEARARWL